MADNEKQSLMDILKGNVGVLTWTRIILFLPRRMHDPYFSLYVSELGGSPEIIGLVGSMISFASLIIVPIAGYLADCYGRVKLIASSFYLRSFAYLTYALSGSWQWLAIGKFYQGLTEYNHAAQSAIVADSLKPGSRGLGFAVFNHLYRVATIFAPYIGAYVISQLDLVLAIRYLLFVSFISMFFVGFFRHRFLTETISRDEDERKRSRNVLTIIKESYRSSWEILKWTPKSLGVFVAIEAIAALTGAMVGPFRVLYATDVIMLSVSEWATILFIGGLVSIILSVPAGMIVDKIGNRRIIVTMLLLSLFPGILFVYSTTFVQVLATQLSLTAIASFLTPAAHALMADTVPRDIRARIISAYGRGTIGIRGGGFGVGAGYILTIPILFGSMTGGLVYSVNPLYPWMIQSASLFLCFVISVLFLKEPKVPEV